MEPLALIKKYYPENSQAYELLIAHSRNVTQKAVKIAKAHPELELDVRFLCEAAMLHDIGIFLTNAPDIGCYGSYPYICHGYLGSELLKREGYPAHALVCERHTGAGISLKKIIQKELPVPHRDMRPVSLEEQLVCYADKFYSKTKIDQEKPYEKIVKGLEKYGKGSVRRFENWHKLFFTE
ncbi:MAG: HD domain-containing protein [Bacteroidales bacterium]|nr:HD domain-containing protein [Bacteroidales bacterium]